MREAHPAIEALGARAVAVGTGADFQARRLMEEGMPFPCLVDADAALYRVLGIGRVGLRALLDPATYRNYWRAWRRGSRQGRVTGDPRRLSGVAILDAGGRLRWRHVASTVGDYPPMATVLDQLRRLAPDEPCGPAAPRELAVTIDGQEREGGRARGGGLMATAWGSDAAASRSEGRRCGRIEAIPR